VVLIVVVTLANGELVPAAAMTQVADRLRRLRLVAGHAEEGATPSFADHERFKSEACSNAGSGVETMAEA